MYVKNLRQIASTKLDVCIRFNNIMMSSRIFIHVRSYAPSICMDSIAALYFGIKNNVTCSV